VFLRIAAAACEVLPGGEAHEPGRAPVAVTYAYREGLADLG
jgi:hypothetical protein